MRLRSLLFVPADSERKFMKGCGAQADCLILDLEDSVMPERKATARGLVAEMIAAALQQPWSCFVRVNPLGTKDLNEDLAAIVADGLDGVLLPKAEGVQDVQSLSEMLDRFENERGLQAGKIRIAVVATETPRAMFNLGSYASAPARLHAMTWGAEDLATAIGASANKEPDGQWTDPYRQARTMCLYAAAAAKIAPLDTLYSDFRDVKGLFCDSRRSKRDGFVGRMAIHPDQVPVINEAYAPSPEELRHAREVVDAFAAAPGAGAIGIDGKMYDIPHLVSAKRILSSANEQENRSMQ